MKTTITLIYNGTQIRDRGEFLNLTDMWRAAGADPSRQPAEWLIEFLAESLNMGNYQDGENQGLTKVTRAYAPRELAIAPKTAPVAAPMPLAVQLLKVVGSIPNMSVVTPNRAMAAPAPPMAPFIRMTTVAFLKTAFAFGDSIFNSTSVTAAGS
jgi:hypothetical protein